MTRKRQRGTAEPGEAVPNWPRVAASLPEGDGRGELSWNGVLTTISAHNRDAAHAAIVAHCTRVAQKLHRPIRLDLIERGGMHEFAVFPAGGLLPIGPDGVPIPDDERVESGESGESGGPAPMTGECRSCQSPANAADAQCTACGAAEPLSRQAHRAARPSEPEPATSAFRAADARPPQPGSARRGEAAGPRTGRRAEHRAERQAEANPVPDQRAAGAQTRAGRRALRELTPAATGVPEQNPAETPAREETPTATVQAERRPRTRAGKRAPSRTAPLALVIEFDDAAPAILAGNAAVGRNPSPVAGRVPVRVESRNNSVSRTHALVDLDSAGRILVTDYHSTHGVHLDGKRSSTLSPGVVYRVPSGAQLRLGDVLCRVSTARAS